MSVDGSAEPNQTGDILVVCRANQARSPLVEHLLTRLVDDGIGSRHGYAISSAGVSAFASAAALPRMCAAAAGLGVDLTGHRARVLDADMVRRSDLIITMTEAQRSAVSRMRPQAVSKVFTLKELVRIGRAAPPTGSTIADIARDLNRSRAVTPGASSPEDVADPEALSAEQTVLVAEELLELTAAAGRILFSPEPGRQH